MRYGMENFDRPCEMGIHWSPVIGFLCGDPPANRMDFRHKRADMWSLSIFYDVILSRAIKLPVT